MKQLGGCSILFFLWNTSVAQTVDEVIGNDVSYNTEIPIPRIFIHQLHRNGYYTVGIGKVSRYIDGLYGYNENSNAARPELPYSWDEELFDAGTWEDGWDAYFASTDRSSRITMKENIKPYEYTKEGDGYPHELSANRRLVHIVIRSQRDAPSRNNTSDFNRYQWDEEKSRSDTPSSEEYVRKVWHSYNAAINWEQDKHRMLAKHSLFEKSLNSSPIKTPESNKQKKDDIVRAIDVRNILTLSKKAKYHLRASKYWIV